MSVLPDILAANRAFYRAFEKRDIETMSAVWSKGSASVCIHPGRSALVGWEAIADSWTQIFRGTQYLEIDTDIKATEISGDLAYVVLIEIVRQVSNRRQVVAKSMATNIFERMGGRWYLIHHHGSPLMEG
ncbi:nuclear transport factor 2 family protein [Vacuolonema iberomarrocanum]|uniref:nuclear transport factor 2 family protein n=1 Tax=Vacuolonema iberomarrocanum TaxID=3454632 RepID=UPI0019E62C6A|nr:nuclear transport factor 2 family protein [filamentous cyanobacterium LEGE 07170]